MPELMRNPPFCGKWWRISAQAAVNNLHIFSKIVNEFVFSVHHYGYKYSWAEKAYTNGTTLQAGKSVGCSENTLLPFDGVCEMKQLKRN